MKTQCEQTGLVGDYVSGTLTGSAADAFESHAEVCSVCCERLMAAMSATPGPAWVALARNVSGKGVAHGGSEAANGPAELVQAGMRYSWLRPIGSGGMGDVWEGWDHLMERPVALKRLGIQNSNFHGVQRLMQEAMALARLSHPHIVTVFELVTDHARPVLVMEYVEGMTLSQWFAGRPLAAAVAAEICLTLARALHHAHQNGVIHRDVKPSNVLLRTELAGVLPRTENGVPDLRLSDFGLARIVDDPALTCTGQMLGTPTYMAPEQISEGRIVDARTDVYSLGVILYELLTGRPPFAASEAVVVLEMIRTKDPLRPRVLQPHLARDIETICLKCLAHDPSRRYSSAEEAAEDLRAFLENRPVRARPVSRVQLALRWAARNRASTVLGLLASAAITATVVSAVLVARSYRLQAVLERESREQAQLHLREAIAIVDGYVRLVGEPNGIDTRPGTDVRAAASEEALRVYRNYIEQLDAGPVLSWDDLEIVCRFLGLQRFSRNHDLTESCLRRVDESLAHYRLAPEDPEKLVDFLRIRHCFFSIHEQLDELQTRQVNDWLQCGQTFLQLASVSTVQHSRVQSLLRARQTALLEATLALNINPTGPVALENLRAIAQAATATVPQKAQGLPISYPPPGRAYDHAEQVIRTVIAGHSEGAPAAGITGEAAALIRILRGTP